MHSPVDWHEHMAMVQRLKSRRAVINDTHIDLMHAVMGITGECHELWRIDIERMLDGHLTPATRLNLIEELGDMLWYCQLGLAAVDVDRTDTFERTDLALVDFGTVATLSRADVDSKAFGHALRTYIVECQDQLGILADQVKRLVFYGTEMDAGTAARIAGGLMDIVTNINDMALLVDSTIEEVRDINHAKLMRRYQSGQFSRDSAVHRDLEGEVQAMQGHPS